jgi:hypothetical protein
MNLYLKAWVLRIDVIYVAFDIERTAANHTGPPSLHSLPRVALPFAFDLR